MKLTPFILTLACLLASLHAEERFLLAADNQVIEINRAGKVTDILKHPRHIGIYDAWHLPDGGIAYAHRGGLAVFDAAHKLLLDHPVRAGASGTEANSCAVLDGGSKFALMDSGACQIRVVDRSGSVISETPLPDLAADSLHFRYRMIRPVRGEDSFWAAQYARKTLLKVEMQTGKIQQTIPLEPLLKPTPTTKKAFAVLQSGDGSLFASTSTGCQLLHLDASGKAQQCWTREDLGLSSRYLLGMSQLSNGHVLIACGDYHLQQADEGRDLLAEISTDGKVIWRFTRDQLVDQIEGAVDPRTKLEEMRITHVHAYDSERANQCLEVNR